MFDPLRSSPRLLFEMPSSDDRLLWDIWLSRLHLPALVVADELRLFPHLDQTPSSAGDVATALSLTTRGTEALLGVLCSMGLLRQLDGRFHVTETAREFLLPEGAYYWGGVFAAFRAEPDRHSPTRLLQALRGDAEADRRRASTEWAEGNVPAERARLITAYMHAHSFASAAGFARRVELEDVHHVLDVGAGSGCFSLALALRVPSLMCTMLDLPAVCRLAEETIREYGLAERVRTHAANFFADPWPRGHDAVLLSNILHDWDKEQSRALLARAFESLPRRGRLFVHEMLLGDGRDADLATSSFSLQMVLGTHGKQLTLRELSDLLGEAGFRGVQAKHTFGHFWAVTAARD